MEESFTSSELTSTERLQCEEGRAGRGRLPTRVINASGPADRPSVSVPDTHFSCCRQKQLPGRWKWRSQAVLQKNFT